MSASLNRSPSRPTIRDIAEKVGVSVATVSRALNNGPGVSAQTRAMVLEAMERDNFTRLRRPPRAGRAKNLVTVRCPFALDEYFGALVTGIAQALRVHGKRLVLVTDFPEAVSPPIEDVLMTDMTEGAILVLPPEPTGVLNVLRSKEYPFVLVDPREAPPAEVPAVSVAHAAGTRAATQHLIDLGHTRIAMIAGPHQQLSSDARVAGFRTALLGAGLSVPDEYIRSIWDPDVNHGVMVARSLLDLPEPPTAIVGFNDKTAIGAMRAATERGLSVPGGLSVVGFDSLELGRLVEPPLTTVRQPIADLARMGVELLMRLINGFEVEALHIQLDAELVLRASTGPPR